MSTGQLAQPGDSITHDGAIDPLVVVSRLPLVHYPRSSSQVNREALPPTSELAKMDLAFREQPFSDADMRVFLRHWVYQRMALVAGCTVAALLVGALVPFEYLWIPALCGSVAALYYIVTTRITTVSSIPAAIILPGCILLVCKGIWIACGNRFLASAVIGAFCYAIVLFGIRRMMGFYLDWLYTHPRVDSSSYRSHMDFAWNGRPLAVLLAIVVLLPAATPFWTPIVILGLALFMLFVRGEVKDRESLRDFSERLLKIVGLYCTYGMYSSGAPGVWIPETSLAKRRRDVNTMVIILLLTLMVGLTLFFPGTHMLAENARPPNFWQRAAWTDAGTLDWVRIVLHRVPLGADNIVLFLIPLLYAPFVILAAVCIVMVEPMNVVLAGERDVQDKYRNHPDEPSLDTRPEWQWYVDRIRRGTAVLKSQWGPIRETDHLFVGVEPHARFPVLIHEPLLKEHCYLVGDSGSGKTALGIMPLLIQLIRGKTYDHLECRKWRPSLPCPIVVLDLKGDLALFNTVKAEAAAREQPFKFFTVEKGAFSYGFNPITNLRSDVRTEVQLAQVLLDSLALNHGEGYGRSYYSRKARSILYRVLTASRGKVKNVRELYEATRLASEDEKSQETYELISTLEVLASYENLDLKGSSESIHMPKLVEQREIAYFWLPAVVESVSVREIAKLVLYSVLTACIDRTSRDPGGKHPQVYVFIDEFQRIAGENFKIILEQARSFGLSLILSNQSIQDLKTPDSDLRPTIRTNTRVKRYFSVTDPIEVDLLSRASGEELWLVHSHQHSSSTTYPTGASTVTTGRSLQQAIKPRLTVNDILAISDHPLDSILHVSRGSGLTQFAGLPVPVRCTYPMTEEVYRLRQGEAWPRPVTISEDEQAAGVELPPTPTEVKEVGVSIAELEAKRTDAVARELAIDLERIAAETISKTMPRPLSAPPPAQGAPPGPGQASPAAPRSTQPLPPTQSKPPDPPPPKRGGWGNSGGKDKDRGGW